MPPRAPSPAALRALRSLAFPSTSGSMNSTIPTRSVALLRPQQPSNGTLTCSSSHLRSYSTTPSLSHPPKSPINRHAPRHHDRGPTSSETTQTDFSAMDIFNSSSTPQPANAIDACTPTGFHLSNGLKTTDGAGLLLLGGEAFSWRPWTLSASPSAENIKSEGKTLRDNRGMLVLPPEALALLNHLYPRPDLLILGTGDRLHPLHPSTRNYLMSELGMRVDVMDTANASAAYNLLATERGLEAGGVGAALFPISWRG